MRKTIVHTCSSVLVRPNGILRYINAVIDLQRSMGHYVIFVTDAEPTQTINSDETLYCNHISGYTPNRKDGHVWLQVEQTVAQDVRRAYCKLSVKPDLVISHDLHSYLGIKDLTNAGVFIQHESDVLTAGSRYSFLSDEYLAAQFAAVNTTDWRIGMTVHSTNINPKRPIYTPVPFTVRTRKHNPTKGLLYIGDATERKGAKEFMELARKLKVVPTVITHEPDINLFSGADIHTFTLEQQDLMYALIEDHKVAYISSKNECPGIAVLECLQYMHTIVNGEYAWTEYVKDAGATVLAGISIETAISYLLATPLDYDPTLLNIWSKNSQQIWRNLST